MDHNLKIRQMLITDLPSVIKLHEHAFEGFFLQRMGPPFLRQYYCAVLGYSESITLVAEDDKQKIIGFAVGFVDSVRFYAFFKSKALLLIPSIALGLLRSPSLLFGILQNTYRTSKNSKKSDLTNKANPKTCELSSIAVLGNSSGVGSALLNSFVAKAWDAESNEIQLITDATSNKRVNDFYKKNGFSIIREETRGQRKMIRYGLARLDRDRPISGSTRGS